MSTAPAHRRCLVVPTLVGALALAGCNGEDPEIEVEAREQPSEEDGRGLEDMLDREEAPEGEVEGEEDGEEQVGIEPGSMLGPGEITTVIGDGIEVTFELPVEIEGGTVAPGDLPASLELLPQGGAIVVFEAVGHTQVDEEEEDEPYLPVHGLPDDLEAWLTTDLPGDVEVSDGPSQLDDGIAVSLHNNDDERSIPIVLWSAEGDEVVERLEGHGPPPAQTQHLWLRELDGNWVGVVTYGSEIDRDLAEAIALSLRAG